MHNIYATPMLCGKSAMNYVQRTDYCPNRRLLSVYFE